MERPYTVSWKLLEAFLKTVQKLSGQPEKTHLSLPDPMDNFVAWRASALDWDKINPQQVIMQRPYKGQEYVLYWDQKVEPPRS
ncbi:MAG TPA: hypothetical protein PL066_02565 [bacterium]|nr:hypothetical protein [bacterium]